MFMAVVIGVERDDDPGYVVEQREEESWIARISKL
jgi:hypothetical protein